MDAFKFLVHNRRPTSFCQGGGRRREADASVAKRVGSQRSDGKDTEEARFENRSWPGPYRRTALLLLVRGLVIAASLASGSTTLGAVDSIFTCQFSVYLTTERSCIEATGTKPWRSQFN